MQNSLDVGLRFAAEIKESMFAVIMPKFDYPVEVRA